MDRASWPQGHQEKSGGLTWEGLSGHSGRDGTPQRLLLTTIPETQAGAPFGKCYLAFEIASSPGGSWGPHDFWERAAVAATTPSGHVHPERRVGGEGTHLVLAEPQGRAL